MRIKLLPFPSLRNRNKITDIKTFRYIFRYGLKESKDVVDLLWDNQSVEIEATTEQRKEILETGFTVAGVVIFNAGDKAVVRRNPIKVRIVRARWNLYGEYHTCCKCGQDIKEGDLHGANKRGKHACLKCCERE